MSGLGSVVTSPRRSKSESRRRTMAASAIGRGDWVQGVVILLFAFFLERLSPYVREQALSDPSVTKPHLPDIVPSRMLVILALVVPVVVYFAFEKWRGAAVMPRTLEPYMIGLVEANGLTVLITNILKLLVGRPRPHFAAVCISYAVGSLTECTGDANAVAEARKSFPSGHSSLSFSTAIYASAYIARRFSVGAPASSKPTAYKLLVVLFLPLLAALVAVSRTRDFHHNYDDIVAGSLLGASISGLVAFNRLPDVDAARVEVSSLHGDSSRNGYESLSTANV